MNLKYALLGGIILLLGFLFYPRSATEYSLNQSLISPIRTLDNEPLRLTDLIRSNPPYSTFDLGYIYKIDKAQVIFTNPEESGPRQFDLLIKEQPNDRYDRIYSFIGNSREYGYPLQSFQVQTEARWIQIVINDWFSNKPELQTDQFRVGTRYKRHGPIKIATATHNAELIFYLIDLLPNTKWAAANAIDNKDKNATLVGSPVFQTPTLNGSSTTVTVTIDLGRRQNIHGTRLTTDGPGNNVKRYQLEIGGRSIATSNDLVPNDFVPYYESSILPDETVTDTYLAPKSQRGRFIRLKIHPEDWYGDYAEISDFEVFTDDYRLLSNQLPSDPNYRRFEDYSTVQMEYENLGADNNRHAPHLKQGFAYDRVDTTAPQNRYLLPETVSTDEVENDATYDHLIDQRSFAYHYDTVEIHFGSGSRPLNPFMLYWVQVTYRQESGGQRIQNLLANQFLLHPAVEIPAGVAKTYTFQIPTQAYTGDSFLGEVTLRFNRLAGANAVVSTVALLESSPLSDQELAKQKPSQGIDPLIDQRRGRSVRVDRTVKIDGLADDWHLLYPLVPKLTYQFNDSVPIRYQTEAESPFHLYTQWNDNNFYVLATFNQPEGERNQLSNQHHALHLFIDTLQTASPGMYTPTDHHFVFDLFNLEKSNPKISVSQIHHHLDAIPATINNYQEISTRVRLNSSTNPDTKGGYTIEIQLPKEQVLNQFQTEVGRSIGLNYVLKRIDLENGKSLPSFAFVSTDLDSSPQNWFPIEMVSRISGEVIIMDQRGLIPVHNFVAGDTITLCVWDADRNNDRSRAESITIHLTNHRSAEKLTLALPEVDHASFVDNNPENDGSTNSSLFATKIRTIFGGGVDSIKSRMTNNLTLQVRGGDEIVLTYVDPYFSYNERDKVITKTATVKKGHDGQVYFGLANGEILEQLSIGSDLFVFVKDTDLKEDGLSHEVKLELAVFPISSNTSHHSLQKETIIATLTENDSSIDEKLYKGQIPTIYQVEGISNDRQLQLIGGQIIEVTYFDSLQLTGESVVPIKTHVVVKTGDTAQLSFFANDELLCGDTFEIQLIDKDLDISPDKVDFTTIEISTGMPGTSKDEKLWFKWQLYENDLNSGVFTVSCPTVFKDIGSNTQESNSNMNTIAVRGKEQITVRYLDEHQSNGQTQQIVTKSILVGSGDDGTLAITSENYVSVVKQFRAGTKLYFLLQDADLIERSAAIVVTDDLVGDREKVILNQQVGGSNFLGEIPTAFWKNNTLVPVQSVIGDGILQVRGNSTIQADYWDQLQSTGQTKVKLSVRARVVVGRTGLLNAYVTSKKTELDISATSTNYETQVPVSHFRAGQMLIFEVLDQDLSSASKKSTNPDLGSVTLTEIDPNRDQIRDRIVLPMSEAQSNRGLVRWTVQTQYSPSPVINDQILQVRGGGIVHCSYIDDLQANGATQVSVDLELSVDIGDTAQLSIYNQNTGKLISNDQQNFGSFEIGESLRIVLKDDDLNILDQNIETTTITVVSSTNQVQLNLSEVSAGVFVGLLRTTYQTSDIIEFQVIDGSPLLRLQNSETITIQYLDGLTRRGETDVNLTSTVVIISSRKGKIKIVSLESIKEKTATEISNFRAGEVVGVWLEDLLLKNKPALMDKTDQIPVTIVSEETQDKLTIKLKTSKMDGIYIGHFATKYGITPTVDQILDVKGGETVRATYNHQLLADTIIEDETLVAKGQQSHLEVITEHGVPIKNFNIGDSLYLRLEDHDLNDDTKTDDQASITILVNGINSNQKIIMMEDSINSNRFIGQIDTFYGKTLDHNSKIKSLSALALIGGEIITAQYIDQLTETGATNIPVAFNCRTNLHAFAQYTEQHIVIDGVNDQWPLENAIRTDKDIALLWLQWDHDALYFLAQIRDQSVEVQDPLAYFRGSDALEIHLDLDPEKAKKPIYLQKQIAPINSFKSHNQTDNSNLNNRYIFWFCPKGGGFDGQKPYMGQAQPRQIPNYQANGLRFAVRYSQSLDEDNTQPYYTIEGRIPFFPLLPQFDPLKTERNHRLGFNFVIYRSDNQSVQWAQPMTGVQTIFPSDLGLLVLLP